MRDKHGRFTKQTHTGPTETERLRNELEHVAFHLNAAQGRAKLHNLLIGVLAGALVVQGAIDLGVWLR